MDRRSFLRLCGAGVAGAVLPVLSVQGTGNPQTVPPELPPVHGDHFGVVVSLNPVATARYYGFPVLNSVGGLTQEYKGGAVWFLPSDPLELLQGCLRSLNLSWYLADPTVLDEVRRILLSRVRRYHEVPVRWTRPDGWEGAYQYG